MKSKTLYIIGNGFDLHHRLKTSYYSFSKYLKKKDSSLYELLDNNIAFPSSDEDLWRRFEENLANLDVEHLLDDNREYLPDIASDDFRDRDMHIFPNVMQQLCENLTTDLLDAFREFILQVTVPESAAEKKLNLDKSALFLSFNYTNTLQALYDVGRNRIFYIHNCAHEFERLILGHAVDPKTFEEKAPEPPSNLDPEDLERWYKENDPYDYPYDEGKENIMRYFQDMYKPTKEIIDANQAFFKELHSITTIFCFGHSLSEVDLPYFREIVQKTKDDLKWWVSYYNEEDIDHHLNSLLIMGVKEQNIKFVNLEDLQIANQQLKLF